MCNEIIRRKTIIYEVERRRAMIGAADPAATPAAEDPITKQAIEDHIRDAMAAHGEQQPGWTTLSPMKLFFWLDKLGGLKPSKYEQTVLNWS